MSPELTKLIDYAISKNASDLHLNVGVPPVIRVDGRLLSIPEEPILTVEKNQELISTIVTPEQLKLTQIQKDLDFSFGYNETRFRTNIYFERGNLSGSLRLIPGKIRSIAELGLPPILEKFCKAVQGLMMVTGPTGHGKSTTAAAMIDHINKNRFDHIITIEDPIEYVFHHQKSIISQREIGTDANSFATALRAALREDPNVVLVGEMRDLETIEATLTLAETGHLVLATLHTNNAAQTTDRIIDVFPPHQQNQVRMQLANVLLGTVSQRLIPKISGGRIVACEILVADAAVRNTIREGKTHQLPNIISTSAAQGMILLDKVLAELVSKGEISIDDALAWATDPKELKMMVY